MTPSIATLVRASGKGADLWKISCTYDGGSAPTLDDSMSDRSPDISTPVEESAAGVTIIRFPKSDRVWLLSASFEAATPGTAANNKRPVISALDETAAAAGQATVRLFDPDGTDPTDTNSGDRLTVILLLERN